MQKTIEKIAGDTDGVSFEFAVYRIKGHTSGAPSAYLQAALHGGELPGTVAIDALMPKLRAAEEEGRVLGDITIVPSANPIGRAQYLFGELQGRFNFGTRINFNRDFPLIDRPDAALLPHADALTRADQRLKTRLVALSMGHDLVLDLHCDDEGVPYLYVPAELWPAMADCAAALGVEAVLTWHGYSDAAFEEASIHPYLASGADLADRVVTTVELRGIADVERGYAKEDAEGLYRLLVARGVIADPVVEPAPAFGGVAAPLANVEMMKTPKAGAVLYDVRPGHRVEEGARLATIVFAPGEEDGSLDILAPQSGYVLTRRSTRALRAGDDVLKLIGDRPAVAARTGTLEE
jgi:uncharacterized protein